MATPIAAAITRVRTKPVRRDTRVPAAIRALDFRMLAPRPAERGAGTGAVRCSGSAARGGPAGPSGAKGSAAGCWSRYRCAYASYGAGSSAAWVTRSSTPTYCVVASSPYGIWYCCCGGHCCP
ncbi:hypothetical protein M2266_003601 [Streptomyces sp. SPB162]|nr:hypothetical protein [Streptomyces sp. SPB162]